ncbi:uncharacterized protein A4U43_C07F34590 [Asparagus officinalis]|uniref:Uncharacterized protein n=1 Tax=Asparagus officinalis TaxID=4686 RepID=A0A5P1EH08_ASPOF|nr:uncharacterized protein A4U43_C07F34590 [Asparagus officinalis]
MRVLRPRARTLHDAAVPEIDADAPFSVAFSAVGHGLGEVHRRVRRAEGHGPRSSSSEPLASARSSPTSPHPPSVAAWFANVHAKTGTPINATIIMLAATASVAFFTNLQILSNLLSISTLFIFMLVGVALIVRRYYVSGETTNSDRNKMVVLLLMILASSTATAVYWATSKKGWIGYCITVPVWVRQATMGLWLGVPQAREAKLMGVPMVRGCRRCRLRSHIFAGVDRREVVH